MIGVFDSGLGGLTVLKEFIRLLPQYDYLYLGDNARAPYGDKDQETIYQFSKQAVEYLFSQGCTLVILACNTASAEALRRLQQDYADKKILGVLIPLAEAAVATGSDRIGILATKATVDSGSYRREILKLQAKTTVVQLAAPLLVPLIEAGEERGLITRRVVKKYILQLKNYNITVLILGSTHYGFIAALAKRYLGKKIICLDSGIIVASKLQNYLQRHQEVETSLSQRGQVKILTTGDPGIFDRSGRRFFGQEIHSEHIKL